MTMVLASTTSLAPPRLTSNDADRWRALAAVASPDNRKISIDLAACDAALVSAARESEARYGIDSQEAKISYALLEECRQRDARRARGAAHAAAGTCMACSSMHPVHVYTCASG